MCCAPSNATSTGTDCGNPPGESFQAPAPEKLASYFSIPTSGYTQSIPTPTPSSSPSTFVSLTSNICTPPETHLTAGASAGIGAGAGLGTVLVGLVILFLISNRYRRRIGSVTGGGATRRNEGRAKSQQEQVDGDHTLGWSAKSKQASHEKGLLVLFALSR
ncbi:hypothetical protein PG985_011445 [Apiospora marii]|uniref:Uncharacterized protein n=1 Tax=Apiospora marii TaxID=335849 RepID=A0ABR1STS3_9PEZI